MALEADLKSKANRSMKKDRRVDLSAAFLPGQCYSWCSSVRPEVARLIVTTNPHSLPIFSASTMSIRICLSFPRLLAARPSEDVRANACALVMGIEKNGPACGWPSLYS